MKTGRNAPCPCGSRKKYKKCCMNKEKAPGDLLWHRLGDAHDCLVNNLLKYARDSCSDAVFPIAMDEFLVWPEDEDPRDLIGNHLQLFFPWFFFNWTYDPEDFEEELTAPAYQTIAEAYAKEPGSSLDQLQKRIIEAACDQPFSFYEVMDCTPGEGFRLKDVFLGHEKDVMEKQGSEKTRPGDILMARIVQVDHVAILVGSSSIIIPPRLKPDIIRLRSAIIAEDSPITEESLGLWDEEIRALYLQIYVSLTTTPRLCNTDGDPLLLHTLHYEIDDPETAFQGLFNLCTVEDEESLRASATLDQEGKVSKAEISWSRPGYKANKGLDNTILGRIMINQQRLAIDVNSKKRAKTAQNEVKTRLGDKARYLTTEIKSPKSLMGRQKRESSGQGTDQKMRQGELLQLPEVREQIAGMLNAHWEGWPDQPVPGLGGMTPREAVKTPDGRESVEAILLDAERYAAADEAMAEFAPSAIQDVRRRLGLNESLRP